MNLAEIRDAFVKRSGRYDLVNEDGTDNGANFFIQCGSRFLDRRSNIRKVQQGTAIYQVDKSGIIILNDCWFISEIYALEQNNYYKLQEIRTRHSPQFMLRGVQNPRYYLKLPTRYSPNLEVTPASNVKAPASAFVGYDLSFEAFSIELLPHPFDSTTIEVIGNFYSTPLIEDTSHNLWSELFPDTLIKAALYQLEIFYRNTEGANDWLTSIQLDLTDAEQLEIISDIAGKDTMGL